MTVMFIPSINNEVFGRDGLLWDWWTVVLCGSVEARYGWIFDR